MPVDQATLLLQLEAERFLFHEAWLIDERRLLEWLGCFADDATYRLGVRETLHDPEDRLPPFGPPAAWLIDDDKDFLTVRVKRLETRLAHAEQPPSFTRHLVTNVLIHESHLDEMRVSSNLLLLQTRIDVAAHSFSGKRDDVLRKVDGQWRITSRQIVLDRAPLPGTLSVFL